MAMQDPFAAQAQQAELSAQRLGQLGASINLADKNDLLNRLAMQRAYAGQTQAPQLKFGVDDPGGMGGAIAQGLGNAFNNYLQLKNYNQQRGYIQGLQQQQQEAVNLALADQQAKKQNLAKAIELQNQSLGQFVPATTTPQQIQALQVANAAGGGALYNDLAKSFGAQGVEIGGIQPKAVATANAGLLTAPVTGQAKGLEQVGEKSAILNHARQSGYGPESLSVNGVPQPGAINSYTYMTGQKPVTALDVAADQAKLQGQQLENQGKTITNDYMPLEKAVQLRTNDANLLIKQIEAASAQTKSDLEIDAKTLSNTTDRVKLKELERKQDLLRKADEFNADVQAQLAAGKVPTPQQLIQLQAYNAALTDGTFDIAKAIKTIQNPKAGKPIDIGKFYETPAPKGVQPLDLSRAPAAAKPLVKAVGGLDLKVAQVNQKKQAAQKNAKAAHQNVVKGQALLQQSKNMETQAKQGSATAQAIMDRIDQVLGM